MIYEKIQKLNSFRNNDDDDDNSIKMWFRVQSAECSNELAGAAQTELGSKRDVLLYPYSNAWCMLT